MTVIARKQYGYAELLGGKQDALHCMVNVKMVNCLATHYWRRGIVNWEQDKLIISNQTKPRHAADQQLRKLFSTEGEFEQIIPKIRLSIKENNN